MSETVPEMTWESPGGRSPWWKLACYLLIGCIAVAAAALLPDASHFQLTVFSMVSAIGLGAATLNLPLHFPSASLLPQVGLKVGLAAVATAISYEIPVETRAVVQPLITRTVITRPGEARPWTYTLMVWPGRQGTLAVKSFEFTAGSVETANSFSGRASVIPFCGIDDGKGGLRAEDAGKLIVTTYDHRETIDALAGRTEDDPVAAPTLYQHVSAIRVGFDVGGTLEWRRTAITEDPMRLFTVPAGATRVTPLEIDYAMPTNRWERVEAHTLTWNEAETEACFWPS